jgi:tetratricopeptide (TPR) repeat protein
MVLSAQTAKEYSEMADTKIENNDYRNALEFINRAIQLNDTNQWYPIQKAEIELKLYGPSEALSVIFKAMHLNRKNSEFYNRAGIYYESAGVTDSAIYMYNLALKFAKDDTTKYAYILNRGTAKASKRDFEGAKLDYEKVLEFNPNDIGTLNNIANVYRELKMPNKGINSLKRIIEIDPTFIGPYINLGFAYLQLDSLDLSIKYFDEALKIDPKEALVYSNRGNVYYKQKKYSAALKDINYSISLYPTNSYAYRNLALVYIATNKMSEACETLKFAEYYGFEQRYGDEVKTLRAKHCK